MSGSLPATYRLMAETAAICAAQGAQYAILSPGSRSAPIALSFLRNPAFRCLVLPDERSAAYTALGMARQSSKPAILVCTSGTAALNYAPAVAEAFFSQIPLIVITADRPPEWIAQADNQSIFQRGIYGSHVKAEFHFPTEHEAADSRRFAHRMVNEALNTARSSAQGPVHINIPLREPLYLDHVPDFSDMEVPLIRVSEPRPHALPEELIPELVTRKRILVVAGMYHPAWGDLTDLKHNIEYLIQKGAVFLPDVASSLHRVEDGIVFSDLVLNMAEAIGDLSPDLLITFGGPLVSKPLKEFLRRSSAPHWHVGAGDIQPDTFQHLSAIIKMHPQDFFAALGGVPLHQSGYKDVWLRRQKQLKHAAGETLQSLQYSETGVVYHILREMPEGTTLHLGNSMSIRHVSAFPFIEKAAGIFSNRGTSGIDGSVSAAAGQAIADDSSNLHLLITGDLSFMYDSNGLWNNDLKGNLKIVILNNHGGGIFRELPGPAAQPEREQYFAVRQPMNFRHIASQFNAGYFFADSLPSLHQQLKSFFEPSGKPAIMELNFTETLKLSAVREKINAGK